MLTVDVGAHYRPTDGDHDPGVYRVVGATDGATLLRVGDADGRRVHTGAVCRVTASALRTEFEPAADPDAGLSLTGALRDAAQGLYWSVRRLLP
ncbi:hypothetical protein DJ78_16510 [Halorubrum ezzemoulense]|uniref:Uncharacterized protein n=1 Tax=Halorubrum ezzemoulense TaxID=337243 RepID=A0A256JEH2_HALEZ|nr:hypothetical protein DJ78_16510 [Halorubrum ezzemoulense]